jgi:hypothetical protein
VGGGRKDEEDVCRTDERVERIKVALRKRLVGRMRERRRLGNERKRGRTMDLKAGRWKSLRDAERRERPERGESTRRRQMNEQQDRVITID